MSRYLTKTRFKLAAECPTKLFYTGKDQIYKNTKDEESFLAMLAEGGFQVGELAKQYFPDGIEVKASVNSEALEETSKLLEKERHDDFHVSGYGVSAKVGLNFTFFKYFFIQTELKGGYIDMNDIRTTSSSSDTASQHFFFLQRIITFGGIFKV